MRSTPFFSTLTCTLVLSLAASRAYAQDASYTVVTNDGSTYQGQLVENVVGNHVTIRLVSGEIRTFQATDVRNQGPAGTIAPIVPINPITSLVAAEQALAPPGTPGAPPVTYGGPDGVQIHIAKDNGGEGTLLMESQSGWVPVCTMPCSTTVDPKVDYRLHNSDPFRFPGGHPLDLTVDTGGRRVFRGVGGAMIGVSAVGVVLGSLLAANVFSGNPTPETAAEIKAQQATQNSNLTAGLVVVGASVAVLTAGIVFCALHPSSTLTTSTGVRLVTRGLPLGKSLALTTRGLVF